MVRLDLKIFILAVLAFAAAISSSATDLQSVTQQVDEHYNHMKTLQADFTEIYRGMGVERTERGILWLKKPGKMRWEYRSPEQKLFVSNGQEAWLYLPNDHQARRTPAKSLADLRAPFAFLLGKTRLEKELQPLSLAPDVTPLTPGDIVLRGVPKALADRVNQVILEVTPQYQIVRIIVEGVDGSETEYRFSAQKENVPVEDGRFHFTPPEGTEVMSGDLGQ